ncbi:MAG: DUF4892 domain-containing protein [Halioglobus sp.]
MVDVDSPKDLVWQSICLSILLLLCSRSMASELAAVEGVLLQLDAYPHAVAIEGSQEQTIDHEVGLGALRKVAGSWRFKTSERVSGLLQRTTWQIVDGFTSSEVLSELENSVAELPDQVLLFSCEGRACGPGSQWASRVFGQRILYGRDEQQRYRVYRITEGQDEYRLLIYASARTSDRQYLHTDLLKMDAR